MSAEAESARTAWAAAVDEANQAADRLDAAIDAGDSEVVVAARSTELEVARELVDEAYRAYAKTMENWVTEAPRRYRPLTVPSVLRTEAGRNVPAIAFAFRGGGAEAPVTVTLAASERDLRAFQKDLDKAITTAIREARKADVAGNGQETP